MSNCAKKTKEIYSNGVSYHLICQVFGVLSKYVPFLLEYSNLLFPIFIFFCTGGAFIALALLQVCMTLPYNGWTIFF